MPDYSRGKIYRLICDNPDLFYIGSTTQQYLCNRYQQHKQDFKKGKGITSKKLFEAGNVKIELLELFSCSCKEELLFRERHWIEQLDCINKMKPIVTKEEAKQTKREYDQTPIMKKKKKEYIEKTKEQKREYDRQHYLANKAKKIEYQKQYYIEHQQERLDYIHDKRSKKNLV
jgi:hypothetical protein